MNYKKKLSVSAAFLTLVLGFQNCSPNGAGVGFKENASKATETTDSGTPYEGKVYAILGDLCSDGTEIHSRIVMSSSTKAELNRKNCQDVTPVQLTATDFQIDSASDSMIYNNQTYKYLGVGPFGITNLSVTNDANNFYYGYTYEGQPSFLQIFLDTDNNPATGFSKDGIGADYLIENDTVWQYSAASGAPQHTWAWSSLVSANKNNVAPNISWSFARSAIGSPAILKLVANTSFGGKTGVITQIPK